VGTLNTATNLLISGAWKAIDFATGKPDKHFAKQASEWGTGNITKDAYLKRAQNVLNSCVGGDIEGFVSKEGWVFRYNTRTNEFATAKIDGTIETLFRPNTGIDYWYEQIIKYGGG
jgi:pyocin large subunit-like protein